TGYHQHNPAVAGQRMSSHSGLGGPRRCRLRDRAFDGGCAMRIKPPVLAAIAVVAGLLTACDGDDRPVTAPTGIALPSGAAEPAAPPGEDADIPAMTPVPATPAPQPGGATSAATTPAAPATPAETTPPAASDGSGHGLCLDPNSELVASAIAGL